MSNIALDVLKERYFQPGEETWRDVCVRVATFMGVNSSVLEAMVNHEFIPNSPCLMNAGTANPMLSACFAVGLEDSMEGIFDSVKACALIHKVGGGTGIDFSVLRPEGAIVKSTGGTSSGPISFMKVFNQATDVVKQAGKRRGANLGALDIDHPDIEKFIDCKKTEGTLSNFNISVKITDEFMERVNAGNEEAVNLFDKIAENNWNNGEPGILFVDARERDNKTPKLGKLDKQNPCAETTLLPWESCTLGSINLVTCMDGKKFDWGKFERLTKLGIYFLDAVLDKNAYPLPAIKEATLKTRRLGLGVMGLADMFIIMGIRYGTPESIEIVESIFEFMREKADKASRNLAARKGPYSASEGDDRRNASVLSIAPTGTISLFANTSSGIEPNFGYVYKRYTWVSGVKTPYMQLHPLFEQALIKLNDKVEAGYIKGWMYDHGTIQNCPSAPSWLKDLFVTAKDVSYIGHLNIQAACQKYVDQAISKTINCPYDITVEDVADIIFEAWMQKCKGVTIYRDGSRSDVVLESNTVKKEHKPEEMLTEVKVANKVKSVLLTAESLFKKIEEHHYENKTLNPVKQKLLEYNGSGRILPKTPDYLAAGMWPRRSGCGKMIISVGEAFGKPHSITVQNEGGGCHAMTNAVAKLIALCLRWGVPQWDIVKVLRSVDCRVAMTNPKSQGKSCADIIGQVLIESYPSDDAPSKVDIPKVDTNVPPSGSRIIPQEPTGRWVTPDKYTPIGQVPCPKCGEGLVFESGCRTCMVCGWSKCS